MQVDKACEQCGKQFRARHEKARFCSRQCLYRSGTGQFVPGESRGAATQFGKKPAWNKGKRQYTEHVCEGCQKHFRRVKGSSYTGRFCSMKCKAKVMHGGHHPNWRGGRWQVKAGYMMVKCPLRNRYNHEHHVIGERVLGRKMKRDELVHHLNADKSDNDNRNLLICTIGYHRSLERRMSEMWQREHFPSYKDVAPAS
jgi:hypothetical protein